MVWADAFVIVFETLCLPDQLDGLEADVRGALAAHELATSQQPRRWVTAGIRLGAPPSEEERAWMIDLLSQPDDPQNAQRHPVRVEVGGRGTQASVEGAAEAIARALCPEEFHPGPCPIPWSSMNLALRHADRSERSRYRSLFPPGRRQRG